MFFFKIPNKLFFLNNSIVKNSEKKAFVFIHKSRTFDIPGLFVYFEPPNTLINQYISLNIPDLDPPEQKKASSFKNVCSIKLQHAITAGLCPKTLSKYPINTDVLTLQVSLL